MYRKPPKYGRLNIPDTLWWSQGVRIRLRCNNYTCFYNSCMCTSSRTYNDKWSTSISHIDARNDGTTQTTVQIVNIFSDSHYPFLPSENATKSLFQAGIHDGEQTSPGMIRILACLNTHISIMVSTFHLQSSWLFQADTLHLVVYQASSSKKCNCVTCLDSFIVTIDACMQLLQLCDRLPQNFFNKKIYNMKICNTNIFRFTV